MIMGIRIGTAGRPASTKEPGTVGGIRRVAELGLNALEVQFVRGVNMGPSLAAECGETARSLDVALSVHAPYYVNLCSREKCAAGKKRILDSCMRAEKMGAGPVVFHPGYYAGDESYAMVRDACRDMAKRTGATLGLETTGRVSQFGTLDEILRVCGEVKNCVPVVDYSHLYARGAGTVDYEDVFKKVRAAGFRHMHCHVSCVKWSPAQDGGGNELAHLPWDALEPDLDRLMALIRKQKMDFTLISESPNLEEDALRMGKALGL